MPVQARSSTEPKAPFDFSTFAGENRAGVSSGNGGSATRAGSAAHGRSRPRLSKVRRQVGAKQVRSRNAACETGLGFNPFRSVSMSSDGVSSVFNGVLDDSGGVTTDPSTSGGFGFSNIDVKIEKNMSFLFSAKRGDSAVDLNSGESVSGVCVGGTVTDDWGKLNIENGSESNKFEDVGFVFGAKQDDLKSDSIEKGQSCNNGGEYLFNDKGKVKMESEGDHDKFGISGKPGYDSKNKGDRAEFRNCEDHSFVFGASWSTSASNPNLEEKESGGNDKQSVFNHTGKSFAGTSNEAFVFESSSSKDPVFHGNDSKTLPVRGDKLNNGKMQDGNFGSAAYNTNSFAFGSSGNKADVSILNPHFELPDEMKKLNINNCGNVDDSGKAKDSKFVFGSVEHATGLNPGPEHPPGTAVEGNKGDTLKTNDQNSFMSESRNGANTSSGVSNPKPHNFQAGPAENYDLGRCPQGHVNFPLNHQDIQTNCSPNKETPIGGVGMENVASFTTGPDGLGVPFTEFKSPRWDPSCFKANIFPEASKKLDFSAKSRSVKDKRLKKKKGKLRQPFFSVQNHVDHDNAAQENSDYSPMDFSPYQETTATDQGAEQIPLTSNESSQIDMKWGPSTSDTAVAANVTNEELPNSRENMDDNTNDLKCRDQKGENFRYEQWYAAVPCNGGTVSGAETASANPVMGEFYTMGVNSSSAGDRDGPCSYATGQESDSRKLFTFASGLENLDDKKFSFCASSVKSSSPAPRRWQRKKNRADGSLHSDTTKGQQGSAYASQDKRDNVCEVDERVKKGSASSDATIQEKCEKWRLRGNQAYKNGHLAKAEEYYTRGVNSVPASERSGSCLKPLVICYSNRAATRMSVGRIREALGDCTIAAALDHNFLKAQIRAANCHLLLGEVDDALQYFNKCVESGGRVCLDRRLMVEAADGVQKAQKVAAGAKSSAKLLEQRTPDAALSALEIIAESLLVSLYSEELLKMKAEALSLLRRNEEVIQLCEQTISFAEKNFAPEGTHSQAANMDGSTFEKISLVKLWRWFLISKSYFYMGRLETALERLEKLEQFGSISDKFNILESSISLSVTIRELLRCKNDGNEAFRSGRYSEAIEHYTVALSSNVESRPFAAICFCNRAAAHQASGQIADAIADCSLSLALDANYAKAVSRRATLHEMIRDYAQAATDLQRLISILENQSGEKVKSPGTGSRSSGDAKELRQAHRRMSLMEEEAKKRTPLDVYLILGIKQSDSASDIKKAYHKAALKHHPDKAGQFLAKSESGDEGQLWKEIAQEVYKDADRLFKMIGEAYAVLSDPSKRSEYDLEEELRDMRKAGNGSGSSTHKKASDVYGSYPFERSTNRRHWQEGWNAYRASYSRW